MDKCHSHNEITNYETLSWTQNCTLSLGSIRAFITICSKFLLLYQQMLTGNLQEALYQLVLLSFIIPGVTFSVYLVCSECPLTWV